MVCQSRCSSSSRPRAAQLQPCHLKAKAGKTRDEEEGGAAGQHLVEAPCSKQGQPEWVAHTRVQTMMQQCGVAAT